ncbi:MAG: UDP-N-acetylglucosamine 2-epimerase [Ramlibacter sp.]
MNRRVMFVTGTRADFGKLKPLIRVVAQDPAFDYAIFVTGMHLLSRYGFTVEEVSAAGFRNIYSFMNHVHGEPMEVILSNTIQGLSRYVQEYKPDVLVVHGDRVEALAGAVVGALRNVYVAHVEGGELSGTIDELLRHATSKMSHLHFVANNEARQLLVRMGEQPGSIFPIGSPDIDVMLSSDLPSLDDALSWYDITFREYDIVMFHPVTTELPQLTRHAAAVVDALLESGHNAIVIYPNNDTGSELILDEYRRLDGNPRFRIFPSIRFEFFLALLKHATLILGNSSAGIREAPVYGVPTVNVGSRQSNRFSHSSIFNVEPESSAILDAMRLATSEGRLPASQHFGDGDSARRFLEALHSEAFWNVPKQKSFFSFGNSGV